MYTLTCSFLLHIRIDYGIIYQGVQNPLNPHAQFSPPRGSLFCPPILDNYIVLIQRNAYALLSLKLFFLERVKAVELRQKNADQLLSEIEKYKSDLATVLSACCCLTAQLRVAQVTGGAPAKLAQIKTVRKNIARALTVMNMKKRAAVWFVCNADWQLKEKYAHAKYVPTDLRMKKTRAMRRALTKAQVGEKSCFEFQAAKKSLRQQKREAAFPMRKYALKA